MLSYDDLCRHPAAFPSLTGMTRSEFDALAERFARVSDELRSATATTQDGKPRRRAAAPPGPATRTATTPAAGS